MKANLDSRALVAVALLVSGCGAEHPFQKGDYKDETGPSAKSIFVSSVYPNMQSDCMGCHQNMGAPFNLSNDADADYTAAKGKITAGNATGSTIYKVVSQGLLSDGNSHSGGTPWPAGSSPLTALETWIAAEH